MGIILTGNFSGFISGCADYAFAENVPEALLNLTGSNLRIKFKDSALKEVVAYLGAKGTGAAPLSNNLISAWENDPSYPATVLTSSGAELTDVQGNGYFMVNASVAFAQRGRYKTVIEIHQLLGAAQPYINVGGIDEAISAGVNTIYTTALQAYYASIVYDGADDGRFHSNGDVSIQQITGPTSSGIKLLNSPGGDQSLYSVQSGFDFDDAMTFEVFSNSTRRPLPSICVD